MSDINQTMMEAMSRLPRVDVMPVASMLFKSYDALDARNSVTPANILFALHRAREAQELAVSWRNFNVGAAVLAFTYNPACISLFSGINIKPEEETILNVHAEQLALQKVSDNSSNRISAVVVVGEVQADTQSGQLAKTLHPCGLCRKKLANSNTVDSEHTLIVSAIPAFTTIELYTLAALERYHESGDPKEIIRLQFDEHLDLFKPFEPPDPNKPYTLVDTPESDREEKIWDNTIGPYLSNFRILGKLANT